MEKLWELQDRGGGGGGGGEEEGEEEEEEAKIDHRSATVPRLQAHRFPPNISDIIFRAATLKSTGPQMRVPQILFHVHVLEQTDGAH